MRATRYARLTAALLALSAAIAFPEAPSSTLLPSATGTTALEPAFRLPSGGLALAGPVIDTTSIPAAAWLLSEDLALYALTDAGKLAARIDLSAESGLSRPIPLLAIDPFGGVIVAVGGRLLAYTRIGQVAWSASIDPVPGQASAYPPAFGSDGRLFALSGSSLICQSAAGSRLWSLTLPAAASCPPAVDGFGRLCLGLVDGRLLIATPFGETAALVSLGSVARILVPVTPAPAGEGPCLAAGLSDSRVILVGARGDRLAERRCKAVPLSLAWDGALLCGIDASGEAFAMAADGSSPWAVPTGCLEGRLYLFADRVVAVGRGRAVSLSREGEVFREMSIPKTQAVPAISPAGFAYCPGADWVLAAYRFERPLGAVLRPSLAPYPPLEDVVGRILRFDPAAAESGDQLARLADIEKSLRSGTIGKDEPEAASYCAAVAAGAFGRDLPDPERRRGANPLPRARACYLLGGLGSPDYRDALFGVLEADADSAVRASACEALAALRVDPDGRSMAAFLAAAARPVDERTAFVIVEAIEGMTLRSGAAPSGDGLRALVKLATKPYGQTVRERASAALGRISGTMN